MTNIDRRKALILLTMVTVAAILGGIVLTTYAADTEEESTNELTTQCMNWRMMPGTGDWPHGRLRGRGGYGFVEVNEEFEENVIGIAENDEDVQALIDDGYTIKGVRPIIKTVVEANGSVVTKATDAIVMLEKDETSHASVRVDVEEEKVTEIVILTRTVIEK